MLQIIQKEVPYLGPAKCWVWDRSSNNIPASLDLHTSKDTETTLLPFSTPRIEHKLLWTIIFGLIQFAIKRIQFSNKQNFNTSSSRTFVQCSMLMWHDCRFWYRFELLLRTTIVTAPNLRNHYLKLSYRLEAPFL